MAVLHLDFETCSRLDLKRVGADVYSRDPSLIVTVIAWAFDNGPIESATAAWLMPGMLTSDIKTHLKSGGEFRAWNASFEWAILTNYFKLKLDPAQAVCVQQKALHAGLPAALEDAGPAIGAVQRKDATARRLMLQMSKPRKNRDKPDSFWHRDDPLKLETLRAYCRQDVEAERAIDGMIADLPPTERAIAIMDRRANNRGVKLDLPFVGVLKALALGETAKLNAECEALTQGAVTSPGTQTAKLLAWLTSRNFSGPQGALLSDLSKESVAVALTASFEDPSLRRVLEIRQEIAKSSLKKLDAMQRCAGPGDRVRGQLAYYGAFRTGRFAGRLIQPQNFPRPLIKDVNSFTRYMLRSIAQGGPDADFVRCVWGKPLDAVATALRGCLVPASGKAFVVRDLSQIEARVIAWLAGQDDLLRVFEDGRADVYVYMQRKLGLPSRQAAKAATLGLGFGMGPKHFVDYALTYGVEVTARESEDMVRDWRAANSAIQSFWRRLDDVAKSVLRDFKGVASITRSANQYVSFTASRARNGTTLLTLLLPSGRRLYYRNARLAVDPVAGRESIVYEGVDAYTKKWTDVRTWGSKLAENATQAAARDVIIEAGLRVDNQNFGSLVLSVHDELLFEVDNDDAAAREGFIKTEIDARPRWAPDLPVASAGSVVWRYGK
jgi:DNA polymerase